MTSATLQQRKADVLSRIARIRAGASAEGRTPSEAEMTQIRALVSDLALDAEVERIGGNHATGGGPGPLAAIRAEGWELGGGPVSIPIGAVLSSPSAGDANPLREVGIVPEGVDSRRLYPALPQTPLGDATRVDGLVSTGRSLADPQDMQLAIDATSEEPTTSSGATLETFDVTMVATVSDPYPNAIVTLPAFRDLVDVDMRTAYQDSLDDLVVNTITMNAGTTDDAGADLFEQLRKGVTRVMDQGFNPTVAAVSSSDAETLDLTRGTSTDQFILPPAPRASGFGPLWGLSVRIVKGLVAPIVLDPSVVKLYLGPVTFAADPFTGFSTNETKFRYEGPTVLVVRQPGGIYVVASS